MAISTATVKQAYNHKKQGDRLYTISADEYELWTCDVDVTFETVNYATANDATITAATAIQNSKRDGKTITIIGCAFKKGGVFQLAAAPTTDVLVGATGTVSVTASVATVVLTAEDLSTEMTDGTVLSTSTWSEPMTFHIVYYQKALGE